MRVCYFFANKRDSSPNNFLWQDAPRPLRICDVQAKLQALGLTDANSHLRFLDKINGEKVWLDIINDDVECPLGSEGAVHIKVVQQFHVDSQAFLSDLFASLPREAYEDSLSRLRKLILGADPSAKPGAPSRQPQRPAPDADSRYTKLEEAQNFVSEGEAPENLGGLGAEKRAEGVIGDFSEKEEVNEDLDKFNIKFGDSQVEDKPADNIDFLNDTVDPGFAPDARKDSRDMGEFANLMDSNVDPAPEKPAAKEETGGILNLDFGHSGPTKPVTKTAHEIQIEAQNEKLVFANEIDPLVQDWAKDPSTGTAKDIRSLLISLKPFLAKFKLKFEEIRLSQVMSKGAVRKMYFKVIRKIHPDKTSETDPKVLYMFERMTEIINNAFKKHKSMA